MYIQASSVDRVSANGNIVKHESSVYKLKPLEAFFKKHNTIFLPGYFTCNHTDHNFRLQYLAASVDGSKLWPPVPNWFTNKMMDGPDFQ